MTYRPGRKRRSRPEDLTYERDLQATIQQAASLLDYKVYHTYDSRRSPEGCPHLTTAGHGCLFMRKLKLSDGRLTSSEEEWISILEEVAELPQVHVIRHADLDMCLSLLRHAARR